MKKRFQLFKESIPHLKSKRQAFNNQESNFRANNNTMLTARRILATLKSICFMDTLSNKIENHTPT